MRVTVSEMGPMLPARSMNLNDFEKQVRASVFASNLKGRFSFDVYI
ncbi:TPA: hypothetical protein ACFU1W_000633 [Neisseria oralis]